jgi:hypothetical protein
VKFAEAQEVLKQSGFSAREIQAMTKRQVFGKSKGLLNGQTIDGHKYTPPRIYTFGERCVVWFVIVCIILILLACVGIYPADIWGFCKSMLWGLGFMILFALFGKGIDGEI